MLEIGKVYFSSIDMEVYLYSIEANGKGVFAKSVVRLGGTPILILDYKLVLNNDFFKILIGDEIGWFAPGAGEFAINLTKII